MLFLAIHVNTACHTSLITVRRQPFAELASILASAECDVLALADDQIRIFIAQFFIDLAQISRFFK